METAHPKVVSGTPMEMMLKPVLENAMIKDLDGYHLTKVDIAIVKTLKIVLEDVKKTLDQATMSTINPFKEN